MPAVDERVSDVAVAPERLRFYPNPESQAAALLAPVDRQGRPIAALSTAAAWASPEPAAAVKAPERTPESIAYETAQDLVNDAAFVLPVLGLVDPAIELTNVGYQFDHGDTATAKQSLVAVGIDTVFAVGATWFPWGKGSGKMAKTGKRITMTQASERRIHSVLLGEGSYSESVQLEAIAELRQHFSPQTQFSFLKGVVLESKSQPVRQSAVAGLFGDHIVDPTVINFLKDERILATALQRTDAASFRLLPIRLLRVGLEHTENAADRVAAATKLLQLLPSSSQRLRPDLAGVAVDIRLDLLKYYEKHHRTAGADPAEADVMRQIGDLYFPNAQRAQQKIHVEPSRHPDIRGPQTDILAPENWGVLDQLMRSRTLWGFDFDGTLSRIVKNPNVAAMDPQTARLFGTFSNLRNVAVITGRPVADISPRLGNARVDIIGNHGIEVPGKDLPLYVEEMKKAYDHLVATVGQIPEVIVQNKVYTLAVNCRSAPAALPALRHATTGLNLNSVYVEMGEFGADIKPIGAPNKGDALIDLRDKHRLTHAFFIGDELTDEPAFARGTGVRVGKSDNSAARHYIKDQSHIVPFLQRLVDLCAKKP